MAQRWLLKRSAGWVVLLLLGPGARAQDRAGHAANPGATRQGPINTYTTYTEALAHGAVVALDPQSGKKKWAFEMHDVNTSGILTTASDVLFVGGREGYFQALDARTGALLWKASLGGEIIAGPMSYQVDGKQYIAIASGNGLCAFALHD